MSWTCQGFQRGHVQESAISRSSDNNEELEPDEPFGRWKEHVVRLGNDLGEVHAELQMFKELVDAIEMGAGETPATRTTSSSASSAASQAKSPSHTSRSVPGSSSRLPLGDSQIDAENTDPTAIDGEVDAVTLPVHTYSVSPAGHAPG